MRARRGRAGALAASFAISLLAGCPPDPDPKPDSPTPADTGYAFTWPDPLSTPAEPTLDPADFAGVSECAGCHPDHAAQWRQSPHAGAMVDPLFQALVGVRQVDLGGEQDAFCLQCHSAIATRGGEIAPGFSFGDLSGIAMEGVTCTACHSISGVVRPGNAGHLLDPGGPMRGPIRDPAETPAHASEGSDLFEGAPLCASCHDVTEVSGLELERPYREWLSSPAAAEGRACQTCHMPARAGSAAAGGPAREVHDHRFVGVDLPLEPGILTAEEEASLQADIGALLASAASLSVEVPAQAQAGGQLDLRLTVQNDIDAHSFPTGTTFIRQCWLEVTVSDAAGAIYRSGDLDVDGDLRDRWSAADPYGDADLVRLSSGFLDAAGAPTLFTHRAAEHNTSALPPLYVRTYSWFVPIPAEAQGPLRVEARLRFRPVPPFLLRLIGRDDLVDRAPIYDVDAATAEVPLGR